MSLILQCSEYFPGILRRNAEVWSRAGRPSVWLVTALRRSQEAHFNLVVSGQHPGALPCQNSPQSVIVRSYRLLSGSAIWVAITFKLSSRDLGFVILLHLKK